MRVVLGLALTSCCGVIGWRVGDQYWTVANPQVTAFAGAVFGLLLACAIFWSSSPRRM
jgi:hypothetical protein